VRFSQEEEANMSQKIVTTFGLILLILLFIAGLWAFTAYTASLPEKVSQHETSFLIRDHPVSDHSTLVEVEWSPFSNIQSAGRSMGNLCAPIESPQPWFHSADRYQGLEEAQAVHLHPA
jgi:hypothetical protein